MKKWISLIVSLASSCHAQDYLIPAPGIKLISVPATVRATIDWDLLRAEPWRLPPGFCVIGYADTIDVSISRAKWILNDGITVDEKEKTPASGAGE